MIHEKYMRIVARVYICLVATLVPTEVYRGGVEDK